MERCLKILCVIGTMLVIVMFSLLVVALAMSILDSAVQGYWIRVAGHSFCLLIIGALAVLIISALDSLVR